MAWSGSYSDLTNKPTIPEGSAANYQVANNDTTEAEGFVADARIVRTHGLEIDGLSRDLSAMNDNGAITGMDAREDGVYITYSTGADTVTKKLGKTDRHVIKSGVGNGSFSVAHISGYEKLTAEDFAFVVTNAKTSSSHRDSDYGGRAAYDPVATCSPTLSYDASSGTITITGCAGSNSVNGPANSVENRGVGLTGTVYFYGDM